MHDINVVFAECCRKLENVGIEHGTIVSVAINARIKQRWGQCKRRGNMFTIEVSSRLVNDSVKVEALEDTVIHELLHTCAGCFNHGDEWQRLADIVNREYGYHVKRTTSPAEKGFSEDDMHKDAKYHFRCEKCGNEVAQYRASNFTRCPWMYQCAHCGGKFERI